MEMHAIVRGRVHGVGFRATTQKLAISLHLTGTVRNVPDGTVEIYAQGDKVALEQLVNKLNDFFGTDYIESIQAHYQETSKKFINFSIVI